MLYRLIRSPVQFFDQTPIGRISNRMSYDTEVLDWNLFTLFNPTIAQVGEIPVCIEKWVGVDECRY